MLEIVLVFACIGLVCYAGGLRSELRFTNELWELSKQTNERLVHELEAANKQIKELKGESDTKKIPDFLFADDPLDALLQEVGRVRPGRP